MSFVWSDETVDAMRAWAWKNARGRGLNIQDAEDASQEAALKVWRARSRLDKARDPWPFLQTIARQAVSTGVRDQTRRNRDLPIGLPNDDPQDDGSYLDKRYENDVEEQVMQRESAVEVWRALRALPDVERDVVIELFIDGLTPAEVAAKHGWSDSSGRVRQVRRAAFEHLRQVLS